MTIKCPKCHSDNPDTLKFCGECGTQLKETEAQPLSTQTIEASREELTTGSTFADRYQIIEELGKGGMGKVYRAVDKKLKEEVALKLIKPEIALDKKTLERFQNELKLARKIRHSNVGGMYELLEDKGKHYITMEYVSGEDLKSFIQRSGQLAIGTTIRIAKQVCEGLAEAHKLGIVHRDLKPSNIMIDKEGDARIMDFGIAHSLEAKGITGTGVMIGTPEYMSPEQVEGKETDKRSDIYSLGVILYEMVTGQVPFEGDTPFTIGMKHKNKIPQNPKEINSLIPDDLNRLILKCLEKDKSKRFQAIEGLKSALNHVGEPTTEIIKEPKWENSIAVLPFVDLSPQKDQEYFCDGMSEELINSLSNIKNLKVVARTSAFSFKKKETDIRNIGKQLDVDTVLEGSIRKAGNRLRITAQLINVADGYHLWSEKYDRELDDVFAIQDEVALAIVDKLKLKLLGDEKERLTKHHTDDLGAYDLYSKGLFFWNWRTEKGLKKAIEYFQQAIHKDPGYALAYVGLSDSYVIMPEYVSIDPLDAYEKAKEAVSRALEIDNTLAEAHASLAAYKMFHDFDWDGAKDEFKKAIDLNPSYAWSYYRFGICIVCNAQFDEAIDLIKKGLELDPVSLVMHGGLGWVFCMAGQYDEAIRIVLKTSEMKPEFGSLHYVLGLAYYHKEMYQKALEEFQKEKELDSAFTPLAEAWTEITAKKIGKKGHARQVLSDLSIKSASSYVSHYYLACHSLAIGEIDECFKWLEMAYDHRDFWLLFIKIDPFFNDVRSDPRFKALLKKMNLD